MQINTSTANKLSQLCLRVSNAEKKAQENFDSEPINIIRKLSNNPYDKINRLCCCIKKLEKDVGIPSDETKPSYRPVGINGNAFLSNKVNQLCNRVAHIERILSSNV